MHELTYNSETHIYDFYKELEKYFRTFPTISTFDYMVVIDTDDVISLIIRDHNYVTMWTIDTLMLQDKEEMDEFLDYLTTCKKDILSSETKPSDDAIINLIDELIDDSFYNEREQPYTDVDNMTVLYKMVDKLTTLRYNYIRSKNK